LRIDERSGRGSGQVRSEVENPCVRRTLVAALAVLAVVVAVALASWSPVAAQERDIEGEGDAAKVRISDEANENRIDQAVLGLLIIAVGLSLLTLLFWWHTNPGRRARILAARAGPAVDARAGPEPGDDGG